jgi:putative endonuclease
MSHKREKAEQRGREGEAEAAMWLAAQGWQILAERVKTKRGEIDLIARKGALVAFIEVKWRARAADLDFAIDEHRLRRVAAAAEVIAHDFAAPTDDLRIDVILLAPGRKPTHIENAYQP